MKNLGLAYFFGFFVLAIVTSSGYAQSRTVYGPGECSDRAAEAATINGFRLADQGKHDDALVEYKKAVRAEPTCAATYLNLGTGYYFVGLHNELACILE